MNPGSDTAASIALAASATGSGPLTEAAIERHIAPLFSRVLDSGRGVAYAGGAGPRGASEGSTVRGTSAQSIYLANHSLGRPLDATANDVAEAILLWQTRMGNAWDAWSDEISAYRSRLAQLLGAARADCVVPKTSAGQGLRAILNTYDAPPRVVATRGEFDSVDVILKHYAARGRIALRFVEARGDGLFAAEDLVAAVRGGADLLVVSQVMFDTGQITPELGPLVAAAQAAGTRVLLDTYHSAGVFPVDLSVLDVDFAIGGSYKYLRGGPGACYLYLHPRHLDGKLSTLDVGWFGKREPFSYLRPDPPEFAAGGDAFLESTPPVLTCYQARSGQLFTLAMGVERLRAYSLMQQQRLVSLLVQHGIDAVGGTRNRGAFLILSSPKAKRWAIALNERGLKTDARGAYLRLCPDLLTTDEELVRAADIVAGVVATD